MTAKKSRRVVIINDIKSDMIEQAIFILRTNTADKAIPVRHDIASEAQEIINHYIRTVERTSLGPVSSVKSRATMLKRAFYVVTAICAVVASLGIATHLIKFLLASIGLS